MTLHFEPLPRCDYGVYDPSAYEDGYVGPCGEPAASRCTWDGTAWLYLCEAHARAVEEAEDCEPDAVAPDAVAPDAVAPDAVAPDAVAPDAVAVEGSQP